MSVADITSVAMKKIGGTWIKGCAREGSIAINSSFVCMKSKEMNVWFSDLLDYDWAAAAEHNGPEIRISLKTQGLLDTYAW